MGGTGTMGDMRAMSLRGGSAYMLPLHCPIDRQVYWAPQGPETGLCMLAGQKHTGITGNSSQASIITGRQGDVFRYACILLKEYR